MPLDLPPLRAPVIADLVPSVDAEHEDLLAWLNTEFEWDLTGSDASDPAWRLTRLIAYRSVLLRQTVADSVSRVSIEFASGAMLDHVGRTYYQLERIAGELDEAYRARIAAAPGLFAVGLTAAWYEGQALQVDGVGSAFVVGAARPDEVAGTTPGAVTLAIRAAGAEGDFRDALPSGALLDAVEARVTAPDVRQQTDQVSVVPAYRVPYDVSVALMLHPDADAAAVRAAASANLHELCRLANRIGGRISVPLIAGAVVNPAHVREAEVQLHEVESARASAALGAAGAELLAEAVAVGDAGADVSVALVDPSAASRELAITAVGGAVTVMLATGSDSAISTTAADLLAAWRTSPARRVALLSETPNTVAASRLAAVGRASLAAGVPTLAKRTELEAPPNAGLSCRYEAVTIA